MMHTLAWKDLREQRPVWFAMALSALIIMGGLHAVLSPNELGGRGRGLDVLLPVAAVVAFTYGIVVGAMLLAGEREGRTLAFLDYLEGRRLRIWTTKVVTGALITFAFALVNAGCAVALSPNIRESGPWFLIVLTSALGGFAWGLLGSALCRNVLTAAGVAATLIFAVITLWIMLVHALTGLHDKMASALFWGGAVALTAAALAASGVTFCRPDWQRTPAVREPARRSRRAGAFPVRAVLWLTLQQGRTAVLVLTAASLLLGFIIPDHALLLWPLATLLLGVSCGLAVFVGEQAGDGQRFLGDQRLPVGRIWYIKTLGWLGVALVLAALMLLTTLVQLGVIAFRGGGGWEAGQVLEHLVGPDWFVQDVLRHTGLWTFLTLGLAYGFGFGQFFGLLTRKTAVAAVLAVLVGIAVAAAWMPSLLGGGVYVWQVLVVPVLLLAGIRPVLWAWSSGRIHSLRPLIVLTGSAVLALLWMAGTFWFRAVSVPDVGEPFDVRAFAASLPTPENNEAGALIRQAAQALDQHEKEVNEEFKAEYGSIPRLPQAKESRMLMDDILLKGWTKDTSALGPWLDRMFQGQWAKDFQKAADLPLGMVVNLRIPLSSGDATVGSCAEAADLFTARALQLLAQGKRKQALEHIKVVLALSRQLCNKANFWNYQTGLHAQTVALSALERWLDDLGKQPALLRSALDEVNQHAAQQPPLADCIKAQYFVAENERESFAMFMNRRRGEPAAPEARLLVLASKVPWEEERETRLLQLLGTNALRLAQTPLWSPPNTPLWQLTTLLALRRWGNSDFRDCPSAVQWAYMRGLDPNRVQELRQADALSLCQLRGTQLIVALALYELDKGHPAVTLDALVPQYLQVLPLDPYSGQHYHYRISKGETIEREHPSGPEAQPVETLKVPSGQGVVWSVGPAQRDNGGTRDGSRIFTNSGPWPSGYGLNWVFLVPRWAGKQQATEK
jgi:hypothetical protein